MTIYGLIFLLIWGFFIVLVLVLLWHPQLSRKKASTSADRQRIDDVFRDDDQYWFGDFFYNNPDDPAVFVPKRFGMGWTVNFGNPRGKLFMIATLLLPLVIALLGILFPGIQAYGCHPPGCHPFP